MNVLNIVELAFFGEWARLRHHAVGIFVGRDELTLARMDFSNLTESFHRVFDFPKVQSVVDKDLLLYDGRHRAVRQRYHRINLRLLGRSYAVLLYEISDFGRHLTEQTLGETLAILKLEMNCPYYPCQRTTT
jgi:hypothetical protein